MRPEICRCPGCVAIPEHREFVLAHDRNLKTAEDHLSRSFDGYLRQPRRGSWINWSQVGDPNSFSPVRTPLPEVKWREISPGYVPRMSTDDEAAISTLLPPDPNPHDLVTPAKRMDEMTLDDFRRGARKVIEAAHAGMSLL